jgi:hypothetical protein
MQQNFLISILRIGNLNIETLCSFTEKLKLRY